MQHQPFKKIKLVFSEPVVIHFIPTEKEHSCEIFKASIYYSAPLYYWAIGEDFDPAKVNSRENKNTTWISCKKICWEIIE